MREINRIIVCALIWSADNKLLMGQKDPHTGGVYPDCWHIPGGGVDTGETLESAILREVYEEVGLDISSEIIALLPYPDTGSTPKLLKDTGETVLCHMEFNRFEVRLDRFGHAIGLHPSDDLINLTWFTIDELSTLPLVPGSLEFFTKMGYI